MDAEKLPISGTINLKVIPPPPKKEYDLKMIAQTEKFERNLIWYIIHKPGAIENPNDIEINEDIHPEEFRSFGFKSIYKPRSVPELNPFFVDLWKLVRSIEQRPVTNVFQKDLLQKIKEVKSSKKVIVSADKSRNLYAFSKEAYHKKLNENVTSDYKIAAPDETDIVNLKSAEIAKDLNLDKRMHVHTNHEAFITLKDHKDEFMSRPSFRLINPAKSDVGKVAKQLVEDIINRMGEKLKVHQWCSTKEVIEWFKNIKNSKSKVFCKFDIKSYYPSITKDLLKKSLEFAEKECQLTIPKKEIEIILHSCESFLFHNGETWVKKGNRGRFDVAMGSYMGAEICQIVGLYILHAMTSGKKPIFNKDQVGLYRDDGLAYVSDKGCSLRDLDRRLKELFGKMDLEIVTDFGLKNTDFLDVRFDLEKSEYSPFRKPNDSILYIDINSDHPPAIKKGLKNMIEKRLSSLSSSSAVFDREKAPYEIALKNAGHEHKLSYVEENEKPKKRRRNKTVIWWNPPYSSTIKTDVARQFLKLIDKHFKNTPLQKHINRNTVKVSYSTCSNMKTHISKHNAKILRKEDETNDKECRCENQRSECPVEGKCRIESVVYSAEISAPNKHPKTYIGMTKNEFKTRFLQHRSALKNRASTSATVLSEYVWKIRDETGIEPKIVWKIKTRAYSYSNGGRQCNLCLSEKREILFAKKSESLNKRDELLYMCKHKIPFRLEKFKPKPNPPPKKERKKPESKLKKQKTPAVT